MAARELTGREREVLWLIATGNTDFQAADHLGISVETVRNHSRSARLKLRARTRAEAAAVACTQGLLDDYFAAE